MINPYDYKNFEEYSADYESEKGEKPSAYQVKIESSEYATIDCPFKDIEKAVNFMKSEFAEEDVYKVSIRNWLGEQLHVKEK